MAGDDANQVSPDRKLVSEHKGWRGRLGRFFGKTNRVLSYAKGLPVITLVGSLLVGYFQYLNAYQDKVSAQAKEDMTAATNTFMEIANAFSEAQTLQQILFFDFSGALDDNTEASEQALTTKDAREFARAMNTRAKHCVKTAVCWRARRKSTSTGPATSVATRRKREPRPPIR